MSDLLDDRWARLSTVSTAESVSSLASVRDSDGGRWSHEWQAFELATPLHLRQEFEADRHFSFKGVVTDLINDSNIVCVDNEPIVYKRSYVCDLSIGDLVIVDEATVGEKIIRPASYRVMMGKVTDEQSAQQRFVFSGKACLPKRVSPPGLAVGSLLKCVVIETNSPDLQWRAYPYDGPTNSSAANSCKSKTDTIDICSLASTSSDSRSPSSDDLMVEHQMPRQRVDHEIHRDLAKYNELLKSFVVPGERLWSQPSFIDKVPKYHIPRNVWRRLEHKHSVTDIFPELNQPLAKVNYKKRFHALQWVEEYHHKECLRQYQLSRVRLTPMGRLLALEVPGLADNRPSLILGDMIIVTDPDQCPTREKLSYSGFVHELRKNEILVRFNRQFHDDFEVQFSSILFDVEFTMTRTLFRRCHHAVELAGPYLERILFPVKSRLEKKEYLNGILKGRDGFNDLENRLINKELNKQQIYAVKMSLTAPYRPTPFVIFGPPGTGKTVTIVESILQVFMSRPDSRVLACTSANSSADLIAEKLLECQLVTDRDLIRVTARHRIDNVPTKLKTVTKLADEEPNWLNYKMIVTTSSLAGIIFNEQIPENHFTHLYIDEAAQVTEPESLIPITLVAKGGEAVIVLAGDHKQLGPVVFDPNAKKSRLDRSLMERLMTNLDAYKRDEKFREYGFYNPKFVVKLVNNYRSDQRIMAIPSDKFYDNELVFKASTDEKLLEDIGYHSPLVFLGVEGEDRQEIDSPSWFNPEEAKCVATFLEALYDKGVLPDDVGIITPYRKQVAKINDLIKTRNLYQCRVGTIEEFQGIEKKIIIISTVRSVPDYVSHDLDYNLGFIFNPKRFNVAVSRAMSLLILIGNPNLVNHDDCWDQIIKYCKDNQCYYEPQCQQTEPPVDQKSPKTSTEVNISRAKLFGPNIRSKLNN